MPRYAVRVNTAKPTHAELSLMPVRLAVYAVLTLVAVAAIWLIDQRVMQRLNVLPAHNPPVQNQTTEQVQP